MKTYQVVRDPQTSEEVFETPLAGSLILDTPMLNKGSAFTEVERHELGLLGCCHRISPRWTSSWCVPTTIISRRPPLRSDTSF